MPRTPINVVTVAQMQALESASEQAGVSTDTLMENAGLACAVHIRERMNGAAGRRVLLLIGPGNNGADGLVIARHLRRWGADVQCYVVRGRPNDDPKMDSALAYGVSVLDAADDPDRKSLESLLAGADLVVDAILGAGRYRPLTGIVQEVAALVNHHRSQEARQTVVSVDLPTGVNPDTSDADMGSIAADLTLALCCPKFGIASFPGAGFAGQIVVLDIGLPEAALNDVSLTTEWMTETSASRLIPARRLDSHKGTFGHLLIVAGSRNYVGAAALAARSAHRAGAGLVTLATPESVYPIVASQLTETIHLPLPEDAEGRVDVEGADVISRQAGSYSALAVGCGMGRSPGTVAFIDRLLLSSFLNPADPHGIGWKTVVDADGLNNLAQCDDWPDRLPYPTVLTPHPGEMATLTGRATTEIQADRLDIAARTSAGWQQTVLLKGAHTVVADPDGRRCVLPFSNPALAAGGTGDVLTGIIGALLAQGLFPYEAANLGGFLHATAGEEVSRQRGAAGVVPSDLLDRIPGIMHRLRAG